MLSGLFVENFHIINGLSPAADRYNTNPVSDAVNMKHYAQVAFILHQVTAGTNTGTATVTIEACSAADGSGAEAVAFRYVKKTTGASSVFGSVTNATAAGFTTTANEDTVYVCEVDPSIMPSGKPYLRMKLTEAVNDPVTAGVLIALGGARFGYPYGDPLA